MNREEIKEYLKKVDKLELKLTGEDKDTLQWLIFGYNECARLLYETEQHNQKYKEVFDKMISFIDKYAYRPNIFSGQLNLNYDEFKELENILKEVE